MGACASKPKEPDSPIRIQQEPPKVDKRSKDTVPRPICKLRTDAKVRDVYKIGKTLGTGGFAVVKLATERATSGEYAVKIMSLPERGRSVGDNENSRDDIFKEIDILVGLNHPNVIYLREYFEENNRVYLITELLTGGELLDAVLQRGSYNEADARNCFVQLLRGIEYLHANKITHRDLKLENLLLQRPANADDIPSVKIADFGLAKKMKESQMQTICGTPQYVAPEVILGTPGLIYGPAVDLWSAGVVLFILLGGYPPFYDENEPALFAQIRRGAFSFDDPVWDSVSDRGKNLIRKLLEVDPTKRLTATQALQHDWFTGGMEEDKLPDLSNTRAKLRKKESRHHFRGAVHAVMMQNRLRHLEEMVHNGEVAARQTLLSDPDQLAHATEAARRLEAREAEGAIR
ncbi:hypothetical protein WJX75_000026 [Coccomyxa subellipsoidea]|uniref:Protein kinase domain-containing protein n=1 Tax=Coccomyxa subellipsoidea TaxID=248742 RepID=A0ABR2YFU3_9CHLO